MKGSFKTGFILFLIGDLILLFNLYIQEWLTQLNKGYQFIVFMLGLAVALFGLLIMKKNK